MVFGQFCTIKWPDYTKNEWASFFLGEENKRYNNLITLRNKPSTRTKVTDQKKDTSIERKLFDTYLI